MKKIYCFNNGGSYGWMAAVAIAEDGNVLAGHICSNESYMRHDLGIGSNWKHENYDKHYGVGNWELEWVSNLDDHVGFQEALRLNSLQVEDSSLVPTRKDDNWNDGKTTIWFEDVSTNDGEILGVVFEGCDVPVLVDVNGEPVDNPAILGSILEAARAAVVNL